MQMNKLFKTIFFTFILIIFSLPVSANPSGSDFFGRKIMMPAKPVRILSLTPATTEILYLLGLEKNIIGVTNDCNYPPDAAKKNKVGKFGSIDLEKIVSLKPDIIFATSDMNKQLDVLKNYTIPVIALNTPSLISVIKNVELVGKLTHTEKQSALLKEQYSKRIKNVSEKAKKSNHPNIFYCIWHDPLITAGKNSFIGNMIDILGAKNIAEDINSSYARYSTESLIAKNPDYIIIPKTTFKNINFNLIPWSRLKAVKNKKVFVVNEDTYLRPAPRIINALEELQEYLAK